MPPHPTFCDRSPATGVKSSGRGCRISCRGPSGDQTVHTRDPCVSISISLGNTGLDEVSGWSFAPRAACWSTSPPRCPSPRPEPWHGTCRPIVSRDFAPPSRVPPNAACDHFKRAALLLRQPTSHSANAAHMSMPPVTSIPMKKPCGLSIVFPFDRLAASACSKRTRLPNLAGRFGPNWTERLRLLRSLLKIADSKSQNCNLLYQATAAATACCQTVCFAARVKRRHPRHQHQCVVLVCQSPAKSSSANLTSSS